MMEEVQINWWGNDFSGKDDEVQSEGILTQAMPTLEGMHPAGQEPPLPDHLEHGQRVEDRDRRRHRGDAEIAPACEGTGQDEAGNVCHFDR